MTGASSGAMRTIRSTSEIDRLFREGRRSAHPLLLGLSLPAQPADAPGRVAFVAGRKIGGAVQRNRAKRVMREAMRRAGGGARGADLALVARQQTGTATAPELDAALRKVLSDVEGAR